jgi:hypothetical protein
MRFACINHTDRDDTLNRYILFIGSITFCMGIIYVNHSFILCARALKINYHHGDTETSPPAPPHKGGESAATERSSSSAVSVQPLILHGRTRRKHGVPPLRSPLPCREGPGERSKHGVPPENRPPCSPCLRVSKIQYFR